MSSQILNVTNQILIIHFDFFSRRGSIVQSDSRGGSRRASVQFNPEVQFCSSPKNGSR